MSHAWYVLGAWGVTLLSGALYAASLLYRGRRLFVRVDPERRRWMTASASSRVRNQRANDSPE